MTEHESGPPPHAEERRLRSLARHSAWHVVALVVVVLLPSQLRNGWPVWDSPDSVLVQAAAGGIGYLLAATLTSLGKRRTLWVVLVGPGLAVLFAFSLIAVLPVLLPAIPLSRVLLAQAAALSVVFLLASRLRGRHAAIALGVMMLTAGGTIDFGRRKTAVEDFSVDTQFYRLKVHVQRSPALGAAIAVEGGGLTRVGPDMLHVTGAGQFSRVRTGADGLLDIRPLRVASPANAAEFGRDVDRDVRRDWFRVMDLVAEPAGDSVQVYVSHHHWDATHRCFVVRLSTATVREDLTRWSDWRTLFDAAPCLPIKQVERGLPFQGPASGGRMLRVAGGLLLTLGDHEFDGLNAPTALAQDSTSHYGKTVLVGLDGSARIQTSGHRNPQGLARDAAGRIWSTEHGPRGGDELNLLEPGANYGWPWRTLGTEYSMRAWPLLRPESPAYREPAFAFVPSPGVSNLVAPSARLFPEWSGDLLVGTLKVRELLRLHLDGAHPVYVEEIRLGFELRDIEEAADGSLVAWTDQGALLTIRPSAAEGTGAALAMACTSCHSFNEGQFGGSGPNLHGVVGRAVASTRPFDYSDAMRSVGGRWSRARLDAFLTNPAAFAPGTRMAFAGIPDAGQRAQLLDYLESAGKQR